MRSLSCGRLCRPGRVIDEARGMVMAMGPCTAQEAWGVLVEVSQHTNVKLRVVVGV